VVQLNRCLHCTGKNAYLCQDYLQKLWECNFYHPLCRLLLSFLLWFLFKRLLGRQRMPVISFQRLFCQYNLQIHIGCHHLQDKDTERIGRWELKWVYYCTNCSWGRVWGAKMDGRQITLGSFSFNVWGSVNCEIYVNNCPARCTHTTIYSLFIFVNCSTCFGW
jgi:hypothetical protein